jgi:hypothetical protein
MCIASVDRCEDGALRCGWRWEWHFDLCRDSFLKAAISHLKMRQGMSWWFLRGYGSSATGNSRCRRSERTSVCSQFSQVQQAIHMLCRRCTHVDEGVVWRWPDGNGRALETRRAVLLACFESSPPKHEPLLPCSDALLRHKFVFRHEPHIYQPQTGQVINNKPQI